MKLTGKLKYWYTTRGTDCTANGIKHNFKKLRLLNISRTHAQHTPSTHHISKKLKSLQTHILYHTPQT